MDGEKAFDERLMAVFEAADRVHEAFFNDAADPRYLSVDELVEYIARVLKFEIKIFQVDVETEHLRGWVERYPDGVFEIYLTLLDSRWSRMVGAKEVGHMYLDSQEDFQPYGEDTLERLGTTYIDRNAPENFALRSEFAAEVFACEILYPHEFRRADFERLKNDDTGLICSELSAQYQVPDTMIEDVLVKTYLDECDAYWSELVKRKKKRGDMS